VLAALSALAPSLLFAAGVPDCGTSSLAALAELLGAPIPAPKLSALARAMPTAGPSMFDIRQAAQEQGISLTGVGGTLEEVAGFGGPGIIHLSEPDHFVVLARLAPEWAQVIDSGIVLGVPRADLEKRYRGHALVLADEPPRDCGRAQVPEFHYPFGISGVGQTIEHTFTVANVGNRPLMVEADDCKSCGAPEVTIAEEILAPGQSTAVAVKFTITAAGNVLRAAKLRTDDPRAALVYLTLQGSVPHDVQVQPARLSVARDKNAVPPLRVTISGPVGMDVTGATCERGLFDAQIGAPEVDANEKKTWQLELAFKPQNFVGPVEDQLTIHTTHAERPLITVPITGHVRGDLEVRPSQVFFGFVAPGKPAEQKIVIASRSGAPFTGKSATLGGAGLRVSEPTRAEDGTWTLTVSLAADKPGVIDTHLVLTTDVPGEETLEVPVYAHVSPAP
jgi:hypothetical protein